jgi:Fe-S-cluster containining protein
MTGKTDGTDPLKELALALEESARDSVAQLLKQAPSNALAVALAESPTDLMQATAAELEEVLPGPEPMACRKGCPTCCHVPVRTDAQSVIRIVEHVRQSWPVVERIKLKTRIDAHVEATKDDYAFAAVADRPPCPFLVEDSCSVHEVRPMVCRAFNSTDLAACLKAAKMVGGFASIPAYAMPNMVTVAVQKGMIAALKEKAYGDQSLDFTPAVQYALSVPDAGERWLKSKRFYPEDAEEG